MHFIFEIIHFSQSMNPFRHSFDPYVVTWIHNRECSPIYMKRKSTIQLELFEIIHRYNFELIIGKCLIRFHIFLWIQIAFQQISCTMLTLCETELMSYNKDLNKRKIEKLLPPFQTIGRLIFFNLKFDNSSYSKLYAKYHFFYCGLLY